MKKSKKEKYTDLLRAQGLKMTPKRLQLLSILARIKRPLSAHEILENWSQDGTDIVTLYRTLEAFTAASIVQRVNLQHGHTDYELVTPGKHHHHLVCTGCGTIENIKGCPGDKAEKSVLRRSTKFSSIREHSFEFFGICRACAA